MKFFLIVLLIPVIINTNLFAQKKNAVATAAGSVDYKIEKIYSKMNVNTHAEKILDDLLGKK